ncbi:T9SS type B sorting domain-containing protein [Mucilaginibacter segetis]|nr:gliding motility-associated C-terminal domain-containing protein [Mucilaginibacter segetis]
MLLVIVLSTIRMGYAQAPRFRDPSPQVYTINTPITPLAPDNRGGSVPPTIFGQVTTFAGNGTTGFVNANGRNASFNTPRDVKIDAAGNLYVADAGNNAIRKITPDGTVSTFAGNGTAGYADGLGNTAQFSRPTGMTIDPDGNLFVVDQGNQLIRKISPLGLVRIYAGVPGTRGITNNTFDNPISISINNAGLLYVTDFNNLRIREVHDGYITAFAGGGPSGNLPSNGTGPQASFSSLWGIAIAPDNNFYVTDSHYIRKLTPTPIVSTFAGQPLPSAYDGFGTSATFTSPKGLIFDQAQTGFVADAGNQLIRRIDANSFISKIAGGTRGSADGIGAGASFNDPSGVCFDNNGNLYVADAGNNLIRKISYTGYSISPALPPGLNFDATTGIISGTPTLASPATNYTIAGYNLYGKSVYTVNIQVNEASRTPQTITFGPLPQKKQTDPDFEPGAYSNTNLPITYTTSDISVASIADGKIHIVGPGTVTIYADQKGDINHSDAPTVSQVLVVTAVPPDLKYPTITPKTGQILLPLDGTGNYTVKVSDVATVTGETDLPEPIVKLKDSTFSCIDIGPQVITVSAGYGPDPIDPLTAQFNYPSNITYDAFGNLYISDLGNYRVRKIAPNGKVSTLAGSGAPGDADGKSQEARFSRDLLSIATDSHGNVYVCDVANFKVKKITPAGDVSTFAYEELKFFTSEQAFEAKSIAIDKNDNIFVADNNIIIKVSPDGSSATLFAGSGRFDTADGTGSGASFNGITGLFFGADGILYVSSSDQQYVNTIRKVTPAGVVTTLFRRTDPLLRFTRLVVDSKGNIFVGSEQTEIYKITPDGTFSIFAGGVAGYADGTGTAAKLYNPAGITIDPSDNLYIADMNNHRIRKITPTGVVTTIAGSGEAGYLDNTDKTNTASKDVNIIITSPITITKTYAAAIIPYIDACPAVVPDYTVDATAKSACSTNFHYTQSPAAGTVINNGQTVAVTLTANDDLSIYDMASVTFNVTAIKLPTPIVKVTPESPASCAGASITFTAAAQNPGNNPTYEWSVNGVNVYTGGPQFMSNTLANNDQITCIVVNNDGCAPLPSAPSAPVTLTVSEVTDASVNISASITDAICPGTPIDFTATTPNSAISGTTITYQWKVNGINAGHNSATFSSSTLSNGDNVTCTITANGNCLANPTVESNTITISVLTNSECAIVIPNTFTPNNDGINDYWQIPILQSYPKSTVYIYNRYGKLIYQSVGYSKPWDGNYLGKALPAGTYYYVIDTHIRNNVISGSVTILR